MLQFSGRTWAVLVLSGLAPGTSRVCYRALKIGDASKATSLDKPGLLVVTLLATVFLHERPCLHE